MGCEERVAGASMDRHRLRQVTGEGFDQRGLADPGLARHQLQAAVAWLSALRSAC